MKLEEKEMGLSKHHDNRVFLLLVLIVVLLAGLYVVNFKEQKTTTEAGLGCPTGEVPVPIKGGVNLCPASRRGSTIVMNPGNVGLLSTTYQCCRTGSAVPPAPTGVVAVPPPIIATTVPVSNTVDVPVCTTNARVTIRKATYDAKVVDCRAIQPPSWNQATNKCWAGVPCSPVRGGVNCTAFDCLQCKYQEQTDASVCASAPRTTPTVCKTNTEANLARSTIGYAGVYNEDDTGCVVKEGKSVNGGCYNYFVDNSFCECTAAKTKKNNACWYTSRPSVTPSAQDVANCSDSTRRASTLCGGVDMNAIPLP